MTRMNVLCVTKRYADETRFDDNPIAWHQAVTGLVEVSMSGVRFDGVLYRLLWIRSGLEGKALTIGIENRTEMPYTAWELYTDVPIPTWEGRMATREEILAAAARNRPQIR